MLKLQELSVKVKDGQSEKLILNDINLQLFEGEITTIVGLNGSGKSTLLKSIAGLIDYDGEVIINGSNNSNIVTRSNSISYVDQSYLKSTIGSMTIYENMSLAYLRGKVRGLDFYDKESRLRYFKDRVKIIDPYLADNMRSIVVKDLSGGQRQSLSLMMATIVPCKVLLLDEITSALDVKNSAILIDVLKGTFKKLPNLLVMMVTHNLEDAISFGNRLIVVKNSGIAFNLDAKEKKNTTVENLTSLLNN